MQPAYEKLAESFGEDLEFLDELALTIASVDCVKNPQACQRYGIGAYPTMLLFRNGQMLSQYTGDREYEDMSNWLRRSLNMKIKAEPEFLIDATQSF